MDKGYTYGANDGSRMAIYAPPEFAPPETLELTRADRPVRFFRLSDRELECFKSEKGCGSFECHRRELGKCQCGAHGIVQPRQAAGVAA